MTTSNLKHHTRRWADTVTTLVPVVAALATLVVAIVAVNKLILDL